MRTKARPSAPELRAELASLPRYMAGVAARVGAAGVAAAFLSRAEAIEAGAEIRLRAWELPDWLAPGYHPELCLILSADDVLRIDPAPSC